VADRENMEIFPKRSETWLRSKAFFFSPMKQSIFPIDGQLRSTEGRRAAPFHFLAVARIFFGSIGIVESPIRSRLMNPQTKARPSAANPTNFVPGRW
jgi:hypothetical protein